MSPILLLALASLRLSISAPEPDPAIESLIRSQQATLVELDSSARNVSTTQLDGSGASESDEPFVPDAGIGFRFSPYGTLQHLHAPIAALVGEGDESEIESIPQRFGILIGDDPALENATITTRLSPGGVRQVRMYQTVHGLPVFRSHASWLLDPGTGRAILHSTFVPTGYLPNECRFRLALDAVLDAAEEAVATDDDRLGFRADEADVEAGVIPATIWLGQSSDGEATCGWRAIFPGPEGERFTVYIDEYSSRTSVKKAAFRDEPVKISHGQSTLTFTDDTIACLLQSCEDGDPDPHIDLVADLTVEASAWFSSRGWSGWNDEFDPSPCIGATDPENGCWHVRSRAMPAGREAESLWSFTSQTVALGSAAVCRDVVAHEFMHALIEARAAAALDDAAWMAEGIGDAVGELFELHASGSADWLHGTGGTCTFPRRSLVNPPSLTDADTGMPFPDSMWMFETGGDLDHFNSTILGKFAYLIARWVSTPVSHWGLNVYGISATTALVALWNSAFWVDDNLSYDEFVDYVWANSGLNSSVMAAAWATGAFTLDFFLGITTDSRVELAVFATSGVTRTFAVYNSPTASQIQFRSRTCPIYSNSCSWSAVTSITMGTAAASSSPAVEVF